ncbi:MAG: HPF/RaiA family ribosome-associated protein, partial [Vicinamibacteria bacterium]|nr:HPF/RaiA family ribosome-associated protein [Vicinamibacteria bacterium]
MLVKMSSHGVDLATVVQRHVERRLRLVLGSSAANVRKAAVHLRDVNDARGGVDRKCSVRVTLSPSGLIRAEATDSDLFTALERAAGRARRSIRREIERRRDIS